MSYEATAWVYKTKGLSLIERIVLGYLAHRQNSDTKLCIVSVDSVVEGCEMGRSTVFKAMQGLRDKGLIKPEHRFTSNKKKTRRWQLASRFILNVGNQSTIETNQSTIETHQSTIWTPLESGSLSGSGILKTATDQTVVAILDAGNSIPNSETINKMIGDPMKLEEFLKESQKFLTVEQALSKAKKKKSSYSLEALGVLWKDLNVIHHKGVFQVALTMKQKGQLMHAQKKLEGLDLGPVMNAVIADWLGFGKWLKEQGLVFDFPDKADIGFFLKHVGSAMEFSKKQSEPSGGFGGLKAYVPE